MAELNNELTSLQQELGQKNSELQASGIQVNELRLMLEDMRSKIRRQVNTYGLECTFIYLF